MWYTAPEKREPKYTVLTYIFNGYEFPHEIMEKDPDAEYLLITDDEKLKSETWEVIYDEKLKSRTVLDRCNYVRFHPFEYAHTDTVVRLDSSIGIKKSLAPIIEAFRAGDYDRCLLIHPTRNTFPDELAVWVRDRHYSQEVADRCLKMMKAWGYDFDEKGLFQGTFEIVRNTEVNRDINRMVYHLMKYTGGDDIDRVDQHIFRLGVVAGEVHQFQDVVQLDPGAEGFGEVVGAFAGGVGGVDVGAVAGNVESYGPGEIAPYS